LISASARKARFKSKQLSIFDPNPVLRAAGEIGSYALVDLSASVIDAADRFRLTFQVRNAFDQSFAASIQSGGPAAASATSSRGKRSIYRRHRPPELLKPEKRPGSDQPEPGRRATERGLQAEQSADGEGGMTSENRMSRRRWVIVALVFIAIMLNYVDRQILALLKPTLQAEFGWSDRHYSHMGSAFQFSAAIAFLGTGGSSTRSGCGAASPTASARGALPPWPMPLPPRSAASSLRAQPWAPRRRWERRRGQDRGNLFQPQGTVAGARQSATWRPISARW
jgi:hypothetical protein